MLWREILNLTYILPIILYIRAHFQNDLHIMFAGDRESV